MKGYSFPTSNPTSSGILAIGSSMSQMYSIFPPCGHAASGLQDLDEESHIPYLFPLFLTIDTIKIIDFIMSIGVCILLTMLL